MRYIIDNFVLMDKLFFYISEPFLYGRYINTHILKIYYKRVIVLT